jgi:hypothetical protein
MRTIWQSLAWKEWHEHKWKLASVMAILLCCIAVSFKSSNSQHFELFTIAILLPMIPLSMLMAASSATSERSRGTLPFLLSLPISPRRVAVTRLISGLSTCLLPVLIAIGLIYIWHLSWDWLGIDYRMPSERGMQGPFNFTNWFVATFTGVAIWVLSMFLWTAASGVNRADEVSAAAVALAVIVGIWTVVVAFMLLSNDQFPRWDSTVIGRQIVTLGLAIVPGGFAQVSLLPQAGIWTALLALVLFITVHGGLATSFIARFGRNTERNVRSQRLAVAKSPRLNWLDQPRRSWLTAIVWKQLRESGPLVLAGLGGVALIAVATLFVSMMEDSSGVKLSRALVSAVFFGGLYLGGFTTLVVGIGVFLRDLAPGIHTFWRSRPISPRGWYWVKFATGALIVVVSFQLPILIFPLFASIDSQLANEFEGLSEIVQIQLMAMIGYVAIYAVAVGMTCLLRSAVYASVLTFAVFYGGAVAIVGITFALQRLFQVEGLVDKLGEPGARPVWIGALILAVVVGTLVGYFSIRYDWGRKGRS